MPRAPFGESKNVASSGGHAILRHRMTHAIQIERQLTLVSMGISNSNQLFVLCVTDFNIFRVRLSRISGSFFHRNIRAALLYT